MTRTELGSELRDEFQAITRGSGCELLDCRFKGGILRLVIDRPEGVGLTDCETISKQISALLDLSDFGSGRYTLEVSSPGLDRKFYNDEDYERFLGRTVKVTWRDPSATRKQTRVGRLEAYSADLGEIVLVTSQDDESYTISLKNIELARLEPEL